MAIRDTIVIYDVTDQLQDLIAQLSPSPNDAFYIDSVSGTKTPQSITLTLKAYYNGTEVTDFTGATIRWYKDGTLVTDANNNPYTGTTLNVTSACTVRVEITYQNKFSFDEYKIEAIDTQSTPVIQLSHPSVVLNYGTSSVQVDQSVWYKGQNITNADYVTDKKWLKSDGTTQIVAGTSVTVDSSLLPYSPLIFSCKVNGTVYTQKLSIARISAPNVYAVLSNEAHIVPASSSGTVTSYAGSGTDIFVYEGATLMTPTNKTTDNDLQNGEYRVTQSASNITAGTMSVDGTNKKITVSDHSNMTADVATVTYTIRYKTSAGELGTISVVQTITKAKAGTDQTIYYMLVDPQAIYVTAGGSKSASTITVYGKSKTGSQNPVDQAGKFKAYKNGTTDISASLSVAADNKSATLNISSFDSSTTYIKFEFRSSDGTILYDTQTVPFVYQGVTGADSTSYWLASDTTAVVVKNNAQFANKTITVTAYQQTGTQAVATMSGATIRIYTTNDMQTWTKQGNDISSASASFTVTSALVSGGLAAVKFELIKNSTVIDTAIIPIIREGLNTITVVMTNEAQTVPADENGNVLNTAGTNVDIYVYEGATLLTPVASNATLNAGQFKVTQTVTTGTISTLPTQNVDTTNKRIWYDNYSANAFGQSDNQYVVKFAIDYKTLNGTSGQIVKYQKISKAKQGISAFYVMLTQDNPIITTKGQSVTITQHVYKDGTEITSGLNNYNFNWYVNGTLQAARSGAGKTTFTITEAEITNKQEITVEVSKI